MSKDREAWAGMVALWILAMIAGSVLYRLAEVAAGIARWKLGGGS